MVLDEAFHSTPSTVDMVIDELGRTAFEVGHHGSRICVTLSDFGFVDDDHDPIETLHANGLGEYHELFMDSKNQKDTDFRVAKIKAELEEQGIKAEVTRCSEARERHQEDGKPSFPRRKRGLLGSLRRRAKRHYS